MDFRTVYLYIYDVNKQVEVEVGQILLMEDIRRSPLEVGGSLSHDLQGFIHPSWLAGCLPSTV